MRETIFWPFFHFFHVEKKNTDIDELTKRCSKLDEAFLKMYNAFRRVPDPVNSLQSACKELQKRRNIDKVIETDDVEVAEMVTSRVVADTENDERCVA